MQVASYVDADVYDVDYHVDLIDRMMSSERWIMFSTRIMVKKVIFVLMMIFMIKMTLRLINQIVTKFQGLSVALASFRF